MAFAVGLGLAAALALAGCGQKSVLSGPHPKELIFAISAVEGRGAVQPLWRPVLADLSDSVGVKVKPFYAPNDTALVETLGFGQAQLGWLAPRPALEAVNRAEAEVMGRGALPPADFGDNAVLIVRKDAKLTLDDVLKCSRKLNLGIGAPDSIPDSLAPMTYLFIPRNIEPARCFKSVHPAGPQANALGVASGALDVAAADTAGLAALRLADPAAADKLEVIWTSPPLPQDLLLVRKDLDPALKEKIRQFFLTYGAGAGPQADEQRGHLRALALEGFRPADDSWLDPVREIAAGQAVVQARRSGDRARIAAAQARFDKVQAAAAQRRAVNPDI